MILEGCVALVTGAGRGIGRSISLRLAQSGAKVALAARTQREISDLQREIAGEGGVSLAMPTDVSDEASVDACVNAVQEKLGPIDILVNNAGIAIFQDLLSSPAEDWLKMYQVNVLGPLRLIQRVLPSMIERRSGRIVMMASTASHKAYVHQGGYCASKHALLGLSRVLMAELKGTDIRVHVISPGGVDTDLARSTRDGSVADEYMHPDEVADAVHFVLTSGNLGTIDEVIVRRHKAAPSL